MKRKILIPLAIIVILILALLVSFLMWKSKEAKKLDVYVLNKTVPTVKRTKHRSFFWILNHEKYVKKNGEIYNFKEDYYGFYPKNDDTREFDFKSIRIREIDEYAEKYDMAYYVDTYGVYYNEWYKSKFSDYSGSLKVYGGLNQNDYLLLKAMKDRKKLIITEFNFYSAPTSALTREKLESLFDIKWTGWTGKYFNSLDTSKRENVPEWIINLYMEQNQHKWPFEEGGVVLVHKFGTILILEEGKDLEGNNLLIKSTPEFCDDFQLPDEINYKNWFDITYSGITNDIPAHFILMTNSRGDSLLESYNLKASFPAIIRHTADYQFYYFAGDFAYNDVAIVHSYLEGYDKLGVLHANRANKFFWNYYHPLVKGILNEYQSSLKNE